MQASIKSAVAGETVTIDGQTYAVGNADNADKRILTTVSLKKLITKSSEVVYKGKTHVAIASISAAANGTLTPNPFK